MSRRASNEVVWSNHKGQYSVDLVAVKERVPRSSHQPLVGHPDKEAACLRYAAATLGLTLIYIDDVLYRGCTALPVPGW